MIVSASSWVVFMSSLLAECPDVISIGIVSDPVRYSEWSRILSLCATISSMIRFISCALLEVTLRITFCAGS